MLQSFPTKAKSAQRSGKKLVEYSFMGGIPQKIETRSKERGLEDSEQQEQIVLDRSAILNLDPGRSD